MMLYQIRFHGTNQVTEPTAVCVFTLGLVPENGMEPIKYKEQYQGLYRCCSDVCQSFRTVL